ncbi:MAG: hypothetical protein ACODAQ_09430 [Phycisphaeraceae bacterium]
MQRGAVTQLFLFVVIGLLAGCQSAAPPVSNPMQIEARDYDALYEASIDVLRDMNFRVDRQDYRFGELTTHPKGSPTALEPWLGDNSTARQAWLSTLSDVHRRVRIQFEPASDAAAAGGSDAGAAGDHEAADRPYMLRVEVLLERRQVPGRRLTGSAQRGVFSELEAVPAEWRRRGIAAAYWQPIERDPHLERRLLQRIVRRAEALQP